MSEDTTLQSLRHVRTKVLKKWVMYNNGASLEPRLVTGLTIIEMATLVCGSVSGRSKYWNWEASHREMPSDAREIVQALIQKQSAQGYVLDLRSNGDAPSTDSP